MKYAEEVISLLSAYPHRSFAMRQIVNHIYHGADKRQYQRFRVGVLRVLKTLEDAGMVQVVGDGSPSNTAYKWFNSKQSDT